MTDGARVQFESGVEDSWGWWPPPPALWSYSSLREAETCPRRWALSRAEYPDVWSRKGYPLLPRSAALFGDVVHAALETIVKALADAGCASGTAGSVQVVRSMGGITGIVERALKQRLGRLDGNPRCDVARLQRLSLELTGRLPDARARVQDFLSRGDLGVRVQSGIERPTGAPATAPIPDRRPIGEGVHVEVEVTADELRLTGRIDLVTVDGGSVRLADYKTGAEDTGHQEQLLTYALLWDLDRLTNPDRLPTTELVVAYLAYERVVPAPSGEELRAVERALAERITDIEAEIGSEVPHARPGDETCRFCDVRQLCSDYWEQIPTEPDSVRAGEWFDFEGTVIRQNGIRSWKMASSHGGTALLLRTPSPSVTLPIGRRVRLMGLRRDIDPDDSGLVVGAMSAASEVFVLTD